MSNSVLTFSKETIPDNSTTGLCIGIAESFKLPSDLCAVIVMAFIDACTRMLGKDNGVPLCCGSDSCEHTVIEHEGHIGFLSAEKVRGVKRLLSGSASFQVAMSDVLVCSSSATPNTTATLRCTALKSREAAS